MRQAASSIGLLAAAMIVSAQQQAPIRVNTRLVEVDVVVRGKSGPIAGLTKQDFTLLDRGKPQEIAVFAFKGGAFKGGRDSAAAPPPALPPGVVSNRLVEPNAASPDAPSGATVLLVDRLNTAFENQPYLIRQMLDVLASMKPENPIALYILCRDLSVAYDFTADPARLLRAAAILANKPPAAVQPGDEATAKAVKQQLEEVLNLDAVDRSLVTGEAIERIARHLSIVRGRKSLVWLSGSFPLRYQRPVGGVDVQRIEGMAKASNDGNMAIYPVDVKGLSAAVSFRRRATAAPVGPPGADIMLTLARETGGRAFYNSNDISGAIQQAVDDAEVTYTLGFYPPAGALDGRFHPIKVQVAKAEISGGADVRYREGYIASEAEIAGAPHHSVLTLDDILDDPLDSSGIGLAAALQPMAGKLGAPALLVRVNVADLHLELKDSQWSGSFDLAIQVPGTMRAKLHHFGVHATEDQLRELIERGFVYQEALPSTIGGTLRVAVQDRGTGTAGSITIPIEQR